MRDTWTIAIHGGAGTIRRDELTPDKEAAFRAALHAALQAGGAILDAGGSAEAAVIAAAMSLEDCPLFNAGHGSTFTAAGSIEMDAALMTSTARAGAVTGATRIRNPILAAQAVMRATPHLLLAGQAADDFAASQGLALEAPAYFETEHRRQQLLAAQAAQTVSLDHDLPAKMGTIGAVARDRNGMLAAATSTGGMTNKRAGRVGDTPILGAGTWADSHVAVSCTGTGEAFMRCAAAHEIAALMRLAGKSLAEATAEVALIRVPEAGGRGGLIAVDAEGEVALPFGTEGMYRGWWRAGATPHTAIHQEQNSPRE
ncbi:isoaspartyl peptidase/L-asparaginase [Sediminicoccus sp. KRV36]|uniref:isoaspartyl peptidase/L-asparaginase family protein n=1 Tax=Sediminicoccus sp. KRV36 TaxID=3133721 RepID=UPI0020108E71|nr:isoaspartyl peptidase/L-asparaginase [Sediminicoccus rosea]UPY39111.1 isoaspartyl peptidase/L-asparaginase [Sediminicoccus rosea]